MLSLSRVKQVTHEATGISLSLERLKREDARPLARAMVKVFAEMAKGRDKELTTYQRAAIMVEVFDQVPEPDLRRWFGACVSDVQGIEFDGKAITTGPELLDVVDDNFLFWLLIQLHELSRLSVSEGNASASHSGSSPEQVTQSSDSPVPSTEREAGAEAYDATATTEAEPSSSPVEA